MAKVRQNIKALNDFIKKHNKTSNKRFALDEHSSYNAVAGGLCVLRLASRESSELARIAFGRGRLRFNFCPAFKRLLTRDEQAELLRQLKQQDWGKENNRLISKEAKKVLPQHDAAQIAGSYRSR